VVKDGFYFLIPLAIAASLFWWGGLIWLAWIAVLLAGFVAYFFRDPSRDISDDPDSIVSPADGRVIRLNTDDENTRVSIFLSIFDVHVNRAPMAGTVVEQEYRPGRFHLAFDDRASVENERVVIGLTQGDRRLKFSLIAGIVARRICLRTREGDQVEKGDRIGHIRFGSRVDILFPPQCEIRVKRGDRVYGGSTILGFWKKEK